MKGFISNIQRFSIHDGPGIRTTVFMQGCPLSCWWCHNPEFMPSAGSSAKRFTPDGLLEEIIKDKVFFDESNGGVTFSGGEPLMQAEFLEAILQKCKQNKIHTAVDTSGYCEWDILKNVAGLTDMILFDLKLMNDEKHQKYTGVSNKIILKNLLHLDGRNPNMRIRTPLIPGITDTNKNLENIIDFLSKLKQPYPIDLLPYHQMAESKYQRLNLEYKIKGRKQEKSKFDEVRNLFNKHEMNVNL